MFPDQWLIDHELYIKVLKQFNNEYDKIKVKMAMQEDESAMTWAAQSLSTSSATSPSMVEIAHLVAETLRLTQELIMKLQAQIKRMSIEPKNELDTYLYEEC